MGLTKEDREFLEALEDASKLCEPYLDLAQIADLATEEPEIYSPAPPPPLDFGFRDTPDGTTFNVQMVYS